MAEGDNEGAGAEAGAGAGRGVERRSKEATSSRQKLPRLGPKAKAPKASAKQRRRPQSATVNSGSRKNYPLNIY